MTASQTPTIHLYARIRSRQRHSGAPTLEMREITPDGRRENFRRSAGDPADTLRDALKWLRARCDDPEAFLAANVPGLIDLATRAALQDAPQLPAKGTGWALYGHIAVVRPAPNGCYTLTLGIHGGAQNMPGVFATAQGAIDSAKARGAKWVICCAPGENGGDSIPTRWRASTPDGAVYRTPRFTLTTQGALQCPTAQT